MERLADYGAEANAAARSLFEQAIELDPAYALAHGYLALAIFNQEWGAERESMLASCLAAARKAVALDPNDSRCHRILAMILLSAREFERADSHSERSVVLNPNDASAAAYRAYILNLLGRPVEGVEAIRRAMALDPYHPDWYWPMSGAGACTTTGRYADAVSALDRIEQPRSHHLARLAACYRQLGDLEAAARFVNRTLTAKPDFSSAGWVASMPYQHSADLQRLLQELLAAGLPP